MQTTTFQTPTSPTEERYHQNQETEGRPTLVSIDEDDVTVNPSEIDDDSTGMGKEDYLGKSNKEE
ncbi:MAG: hypothetical protein LH609_03285 [Rudanella sp.]|nr:hypothetical protein [Rudanella sp.]